MKTVIGFCGTILKASPLSKSLSEECSVAVQALELNTISKLTFEDSVLFKSLISDIFLEVEVTHSPQIYDTLIEKLRKAAEDMGLQINQRQVNYRFRRRICIRRTYNIDIVLLGTKMY